MKEDWVVCKERQREENTFLIGIRYEEASCSVRLSSSFNCFLCCRATGMCALVLCRGFISIWWRSLKKTKASQHRTCCLLASSRPKAKLRMKTRRKWNEARMCVREKWKDVRIVCQGIRFLYTLLISNICFNLIYIHFETDMSPKWNDLTVVNLRVSRNYHLFSSLSAFHFALFALRTLKSIYEN